MTRATTWGHYPRCAGQGNREPHVWVRAGWQAGALPPARGLPPGPPRDGYTPQAFDAHILAELARWANVVKRAGIPVE